MEKLSAKQDAILNVIGEFIDRKGYPPSVREIQAACGISSTSVVDYNMRILEQRGLLRRDREVSRGIISVRDSEVARPRIAEVPILGSIAAGDPISVPDSGSWSAIAEDYIRVPDANLRGKHPIFALRVKGTSMIDDLINDGDIVLIEHVKNVDNGSTVVAWLRDDKTTTLKRFYREGAKVRLQPANSTLKPRYVPVSNLDVQGRVVGVIRNTE